VNNIYWIGSEPHAPLAVVPCPRGDAYLLEALNELKSSGIQTMVSLLEKEEAEMLGLGLEGPMSEHIGMRYLSYSIPDGRVPRNRKDFQNFVLTLADRVTKGENVGIHCRGSIGRATITTACTLIEIGWKPGDALEAVRAARGCPVPDTFEQECWILDYTAQE
jgi:protein-tyrosine phosphatase